MNNNDILRRLRFAFDFSDKKALSLFNLDPNSSVTMTKSDFLSRLAKDEDDDAVLCSDIELCAFLDGFIVDKRGLRDPAPEAVAKPDDFRLSRNDILKKLRIAMAYKEQEMLQTLELGGSPMSKGELSAFFRSPSHKHYRACGNQVLRNFIKGLTEQFRQPSESE